MKWLNRAHEFEHIRSAVENDNIYIFGAGEYGAYLYKYINTEKVLGFVDNSKEKQRAGYLGQKVFALDEICQATQENLFVIAVSVCSKAFKDMQQQLLDSGIKRNQIVAYELYLHLYFYYIKKATLIHHVNVSITQKCTLNCKDCSIMTTYLPEKVNYELESLKRDVDVFFGHVDYVGKFGIVGGEPFLYPNLEEYLTHLAQYRSRILYMLEIVTNGTIIPKDNVLRLCKEHNIIISISDYTVTLPHLKEKIEKLVNKLEEYRISYVVNSAEQWMDFGYGHVNKADVSDKQMIEFFDRCHMTCRLLRDEKLYYCANSAFAIDAGLNSRDLENELDLQTINGKNRMEAIEFDEGYSQRGYLNMCRHCNGMDGLNDHFIEVARQI